MTQPPGAEPNAPPPAPKSVDLSLSVSKAKSRTVWLQALTYVTKYLTDRRVEADWTKAEKARRARVAAHARGRSAVEFQRIKIAPGEYVELQLFVSMFTCDGAGVENVLYYVER